MRRRRWQSAVVFGVLLSLAASGSGSGSAAAAAAGPGAVAMLNAQRAANGIPAGLIEDSIWSRDCLAHDRYMAANHVLTHTEIKGAPMYTVGGAYAGQNAVLAQGTDWSSGNPYEYAPLHLDQLLAPRLSVLGSADADGFSCTTTFPGWARPDPLSLTVYTYPGPGATIYASELAREQPWTPGDLVGLPRATRTGPNLLVLVDAPGQSPQANPARLTGATLVGPDGPVQVETVDGTTPVPSGGPAPTLSQYISPGGFIIPVSPLAPGTTYRAHVVVGFAGTQTAHDWSFTTRGKNPESAFELHGTRLSFHSLSSQPILVTFTRAGGWPAPMVRIRPARSTRLRLSPGSWEACGTQAPAGGYDGFSACLALVVTGRPTLRLSAPRVNSSRLSLRLHFSSVLRGRPARLTLRPVSVACRAGRCRNVLGHPRIRTVVLSSAVLQIPLPARGHGVQLTLSTAAFQLRDAPWTAAGVRFTYVRP